MNQRILFIALCASLTDMLLWGLTSAPCGWFTTALFYTLIAQQISSLLLCLVGILCMSQLFIMTGSYGTDLSVMVPLGAGVYYGRQVTDLPRPVLAGVVTGAVFIQWCLMQGYAGGVPVTYQQFFGAFVSSVVMVYLVPGSQGNRLHM